MSDLVGTQIVGFLTHRLIYFVYIRFCELNRLFTQLLVALVFVYTVCLLVLC